MGDKVLTNDLKGAHDGAPDWWRKVEAFVAELPSLPWLRPQGDPDPEWRVFETLDAAEAAARADAEDATQNVARATADAAAWNVAWGAARNAAMDAAWNAARDAALGAAHDAAGFAAWDAAWDAVLWALVLVCDGLALDQRHIDHARARMDVWRRGYGLLCDVNGALYVYRGLGGN